MSNSIGNNLLHQSLLSPTVLEHPSRINSVNCPGGSSFFQPQVNSLHKSHISTEFRGDGLTLQKNKIRMGKQRAVSGSPQAVLAASASSVLAEKFNLDGNIELQVDVRLPTSGSVSLVNILVTSSRDTLLLHWGAIKGRKDNWMLPHGRPVGTMMYKNEALRSPFVKSGSNAILRIEIDDPAIQALEFLIIDDPAIQALEFLIIDEAQNKWQGNIFFKNFQDLV